MKSKIILFIFIISCTATFEKRVMIEDSIERRKTIGISFLNYEEAIQEGYYNETEDFLKRNIDKIKENASLEFAYGKILLHKRNLKNSIEVLQEVLKTTNSAMSVYGRSLWHLSIAHYFNNDFLKAHNIAEEAVKSGYQIDIGFRNFLKNAPQKIYEFENNFIEINFEYSKRKLPLIEIKIDDRINEKAVIDTGASLSFISLSTAQELGLETSVIPKSQGLGFHGKIIPVWLTYLNSIQISNFKVKNIPVMIFRDEDLTFGDLKIKAGVGFHLLKEGQVKMDFRNRKFTFKVYKENDTYEGNLILLGLRAGVLVTINGAGFYNFILDTGSEKTYITTNGVKKAVLSEKLNLLDVITRGIGKAKVEYRKIEDTTIGLDKYKVWYSNLISKKEETKYIDGILGNDFLENFNVTIDFPKNKINIMI